MSRLLNGINAIRVNCQQFTPRLHCGQMTWCTKICTNCSNYRPVVVCYSCITNGFVRCDMKHSHKSPKLRMMTVEGKRNYCSGDELSEAQYEDICEETLDSLTERFEDLTESGAGGSESDVQYSSGVLTVALGPKIGTYVINKQTPNKQIWLSSPKSGPKRYDFMHGTWIYKHDGVSLHDLLSTELSDALGMPINLTECTFGKKSL